MNARGFFEAFSFFFFPSGRIGRRVENAGLSQTLKFSRG